LIDHPSHSAAHMYSRAQLQGPGVLLEGLQDIHLWNSLSTEQQDLAIKAISQQLGSLYQWRDTKVYQSGDGLSCRIACFRYRLDLVALGAKKTPLFDKFNQGCEEFQLDLHLIPGGRYRLGDERSIKIPPFLIGQAPVKQRAWDILEGPHQRRIDLPDLVSHGVSWEDADLWLTRAEGGLRMPSEAEWEFACRGGSSGHYFWGDSFDDSYAWTNRNSGERPQLNDEHESAVNSFGLQDCLGQVWEWCRDQYFEDFSDGPKNERPQGDIAGQNSYERVLRGGCYDSDPKDLTVFSRRGLFQEKRDKTVGFRVARSLKIY
jgi:hypothetical protein